MLNGKTRVRCSDRLCGLPGELMDLHKMALGEELLHLLLSMIGLNVDSVAGSLTKTLMRDMLFIARRNTKKL